MASCVLVKPDNSLIATADNVQSCNGYLLLSPQEVAVLQPAFVPLSVGEGALISGAILALWSLAWLYGAISRFLQSNQGES
ncbi:phage coat protein [Chromobacterium sp. Panama]|nr:phage coat protein [Chromobacterium sp. Panama]